MLYAGLLYSNGMKDDLEIPVISNNTIIRICLNQQALRIHLPVQQAHKVVLKTMRKKKNNRLI